MKSSNFDITSLFELMDPEKAFYNLTYIINEYFQYQFIWYIVICKFACPCDSSNPIYLPPSM